MASIANEVQVSGTHYQTAFQHWDFIAEGFGASYFKGVITKYIVRWRKKNGLEDLRKARHYVEKLIELCEQGKVRMPLPWTDSTDFIQANNMEVVDATIFEDVCKATNAEELQRAMLLIDNLIKRVVDGNTLV